MNTENIQNERELLCELYSFTASNGEIYFIKPATLADIMNPQSTFLNDINSIGVPSLTNEGNARIHCVTALNTPELFEKLKKLIEKYVYSGIKPVIFDDLVNADITVDDIVLMIKKLAGISG